MNFAIGPSGNAVQRALEQQNERVRLEMRNDNRRVVEPERAILTVMGADRFAADANDRLAILGEAALLYQSTEAHKARCVRAALDVVGKEVARAAGQVGPTPAPWLARGCEVLDANGGWIAECSAADAPLIAAAPELQAALCDLADAAEAEARSDDSVPRSCCCAPRSPSW